MIALELARQSPARVERLVLASTPVSGSVNPIELMANMTRVRYPARRPFEPAARRFERVGQRLAQGAPAGYEQQAVAESSLLQLLWELQGQHSPSVRGFLVQLLAASTWSSRPWLSTLDMPLLAISGSDDRIVPPANSRTIASTVANGRLEIIPGGGHLVLLKQPTRAAELIRDFLRHG